MGHVRRGISVWVSRHLKWGTWRHLVKLYFSVGFTNNTIPNPLSHQKHIIISIRTLDRWWKKVGLFWRRNHTDKEGVASFVDILLMTRVTECASVWYSKGFSWFLQKTMRYVIEVSGSWVRSEHRFTPAAYIPVELQITLVILCTLLLWLVITQF